MSEKNLTTAQVKKIKKSLPPSLLAIAKDIDHAGGKLFLVGGFVRDFFLKRGKQGLAKDFDLEVFNLELFALESILAKYGKPNQFGKSFGVISLASFGHQFEFAMPRKETKNGKGHKGFVIENNKSFDFATSSLRRDFTINAMGIDIVAAKIYDYYGGLKDLKSKTLRHVGKAFGEDPLRALRAVQFAARLAFQIAPETIEVLRQQDLSELPRERIYGEFAKLLLQAAKPSIGLSYLKECHLLRFFPELEALVNCPQDPQWHPEGDVWIHTLMVVDEAAQLVRKERAQEENINKLALMLGALCHDLGKPLCTQLKDGRMRSIGHDVLGEAPTRSFLDRLTNNTKLIDAVVKLVLEHLRPVQLYHLRHKVSEGAIKRLALRVDMEDLLLVAKADFLGRTTEEAKKRRFFAGQWLRKTLLKLNVAKKTLIPWLRGKDLLAMGLAPGPIYAKIIDESFELQLEGELKSPADALSWAKKRIAAEL